MSWKIEMKMLKGFGGDRGEIAEEEKNRDSICVARGEGSLRADTFGMVKIG